MKLQPILLLAFVSFFINSHTQFNFVDHKDGGALCVKFLQKLMNTFKPKVFFETGTCQAKTTIRAACLFNKVYTVELHKGLYDSARQKLQQFDNVTIAHDTSARFIADSAPGLKGTVLFWLDAHYSGRGTALTFDDPNAPDAITPIRQELDAIKNAHLDDCVILIDDIRGFGTRIDGTDYLGCWAYPMIQEVKEMLYAINQDFDFALLGDTFLAYDKKKHSPLFTKTVIACTKTRLYDGHDVSDAALINYEKDIINAPEQEKAFIKTLYSWTTNYQDPMFWHDLWYGLVQMGSRNYTEAIVGFSKVPSRYEQYDKQRRASHKKVDYKHPRILEYISLCEANIKA